MARRMYDLDNGTDDIVVKGVKVVGTNGLVIIKDNDATTNHKIELISTSAGFQFEGNHQYLF